MRAGDQVQFSAVGFNARGEPVDAVVDWTASGGTISPDGLFTGVGSGPVKVTAKLRGQATIADSAVAGVWTNATDVLAVEVYPDYTVIQEGETLSLEAIGVTAAGTAAQPDQISWTATGGSVSSAGEYTSLTAGNYVVMAVASNGVRGESRVRVDKKNRVLQKLDLIPVTATLTSGDNLQFKATPIWSDGSTDAPSLSWSATGGAITGQGLYTAPSAAGTYLVIAKDKQSPVADTSVVTVNAPTPVSVAITPGSTGLAPGASQQFTASAQFSDGTSRTPSMAWQATGGTMNPNGVFTAGSVPGAYRVIGIVSGSTVADTANLTVTAPPATLTSLALSPASGSVPAGGSLQFSVSALWDDNSTTVPSVTWSATGGTISTGGRYTAGVTTGTYRVIASANGKADTSAVTITAPELTSLSVTPATATVASGQQQQFSVAGTWSNGSTTTPTVAWTTTGGTVDAAGKFTAGQSSGVYTVIGTHQTSGLADTSYVTVTVAAPTLTSISITPASVTLAPLAGQQFTATAQWSDGSTLLPALTWSGTGGTTTQAGYYTAGQTGGTYRVIAKSASGKADTAVVTVTAPKTLTGLSMTPGSVSLTPGAGKQFAVSGTWSDGSTTIPVVTWTATGGTVSSGGLYTAGPTSGTYRVIAKQSGGTTADTASVTISGGTSAPTLSALEVSPASASVYTGGSHQFSAVGRYSDGSTQPISATWTTTGGTVSSNGLYTAGSSLGTFRVIAVQQGGSLADTGFVTVSMPPTPGAFPAGYDPARLGAQLIAGDSWQSLTFGSDNGYTSVKSKNWGGAVGQIMLDADPVFGKSIKWAQPNYQTEPTWPGTLQYRVTFPTPVTRFWYRAVVRLDGNGNPKGFTSYGTGLPGGSTTWKMLFAFPVGTQNRMEFELLDGGDLFLTAGQHGDNVTIESLLPQGGAPVAPVGARISVSKTSTGVASDLLKSKEWFELVINFEQLGPARYIQRYFARQLTTGGGSVWAPRPYPTWTGWQQDVTSGAIAPYNLIHLGGNKSQTNDGPNHQFVRWGPWEVTTAQDPYGWDRYGK